MSSVIREATEKDNKTRLSTSEDATFFIIKKMSCCRAEQIFLAVARNQLTALSCDEGTVIFILILSSSEEQTGGKLATVLLFKGLDSRSGELHSFPSIGPY